MDSISRIDAKRMREIIRSVNAQDIQLVLELMAFYRLRLSEVLSVRKTDIRNDGIIMHKTKTISAHHQQLYVISKDTMQRLRQFTSSRQIGHRSLIFAVTRPSIIKAVKRLSEQHRMSLSVHSFRHLLK